MKIFQKLLISLLLINTITGCAIQKLPTGGEKDIYPPELVRSLPGNLSLNFESRKLELEFNEFIKLENESKEVILSPSQKTKPKITIHGKKLIVEYMDSLLDSTTYTINFGNAIKDITEGNTLTNFTFVFSTGNEIDSLKLEGEVRDAHSLIALKDIKILLYKNFYDSAIYKEIPDYFTRSGEDGKFEINYLSSACYTVIFLEDKNENLRYDVGEKLGFLKDSILLKNDTNIGIAEMFVESPALIKIINDQTSDYNTISFKLNRKISKPVFSKVDNPEDTLFLYEYDHYDSLKVWIKNKNEEKTRIVLEDGKKVIDTISFDRNFNKKPLKILRIDDISVNGKYRIIFNYPVIKIDTNEIQFIADTNIFTSFSAINRVAAKNTEFELDSVPTGGKANFILFPSGSIIDFFGDVNDTIKVPFRVIQKEQLGEIVLMVSDTLKRSLIVELLDMKYKTIRKLIAKGSNRIVFRNLKPGNYRVRIIIDENNNNIWDTGLYRDKKYPEKVFILDKIISLKANWTMEESIEIP